MKVKNIVRNKMTDPVMIAAMAHFFAAAESRLACSRPPGWFFRFLACNKEANQGELPLFL